MKYLPDDVLCQGKLICLYSLMTQESLCPSDRVPVEGGKRETAHEAIRAHKAKTPAPNTKKPAHHQKKKVLQNLRPLPSKKVQSRLENSFKLRTPKFKTSICRSMPSALRRKNEDQKVIDVLVSNACTHACISASKR